MFSSEAAFPPEASLGSTCVEFAWSSLLTLLFSFDDILISFLSWPNRAVNVIADAGPIRNLFPELHLAEIDCYHQHFQDRSAIESARVRAALAWQTNAVGHHVIRRQLRCLKAACDIHAVVMAAQHTILAEEKILNEVVSLDRTGEVCAQYAPRLFALLPGIGFLDMHAIHWQAGRE